MARGGDFRPELGAVRRLFDLALDYVDRSRAAEAELVAAFEVEAGPIADFIGELVVDDDDDERLVLTAKGRFTGRVLVDGPIPAWRHIDTPDGIVEFYDPTDLFADLADAIAEEYPEVDDDETSEVDDEASEDFGDEGSTSDVAGEEDSTSDRAASADEPTFLDAAGDTPGAEEAPGETPSLRILRDLHAAGVYSDAEFEAKKAELGG